MNIYKMVTSVSQSVSEVVPLMLASSNLSRLSGGAIKLGLTLNTQYVNVTGRKKEGGGGSRIRFNLNEP